MQDVPPRANHSDLSETAAQAVAVSRSTPVFELVSVSFADRISITAYLLIHNQRLFNQRSPLLQTHKAARSSYQSDSSPE